PDSTITPPSALPCPARNFVVEWQTISAPHAKGWHRYGVASVLSTISGIPAACATSAIACRSTTTPPGLARLSTKTALQRGVIARLKFAGSVGSTKWHVQPSRLNDSPNCVSDPPYRLREARNSSPGSSSATRSSSTATVGLDTRVYRWPNECRLNSDAACSTSSNTNDVVW